MILYEMESDPDKKILLGDLLKSSNQWEAVHHQIIAVLSIKDPLIAPREWISIGSELMKIKEILSATVRIKALDFYIMTSQKKVIELKQTG